MSEIILVFKLRPTLSMIRNECQRSKILPRDRTVSFIHLDSTTTFSFFDSLLKSCEGKPYRMFIFLLWSVLLITSPIGLPGDGDGDRTVLRIRPLISLQNTVLCQECSNAQICFCNFFLKHRLPPSKFLCFNEIFRHVHHVVSVENIDQGPDFNVSKLDRAREKWMFRTSMGHLIVVKFHQKRSFCIVNSINFWSHLRHVELVFFGFVC